MNCHCEVNRRFAQINPRTNRHCESLRQQGEAIQKNKNPCHTERSEVSKPRESALYESQCCKVESNSLILFLSLRFFVI